MWVFTVASLRNSVAAISELRQAARGEHEDLALARGQLANAAGAGAPTAAAAEVREQLAGRGRRDDRVARVHGADRGEQELGIGVLQHEAARARRGSPAPRSRRGRTW